MAKSNPDDMFIAGGTTIVATAIITVVAIALGIDDVWAYVIAGVGGWLASVFIAVGIVAKGVEIGLRERDRTRDRARDRK